MTSPPASRPITRRTVRPVDAEERNRPLPPDVLVDALQDTVHRDDGLVRMARSVRCYRDDGHEVQSVARSLTDDEDDALTSPARAETLARLGVVGLGRRGA